jgi:hypothetical protein
MSTNAIILCVIVLALNCFEDYTGLSPWIFGVTVLIIVAVDLLLARRG